jgi:hypothetical protein
MLKQRGLICLPGGNARVKSSDTIESSVVSVVLLWSEGAHPCFQRPCGIPSE